MLSRKIAASNHYPAIDVLSSLSRLMNEIAPPDHIALAGRLRNLLSLYNQNEDLISVGAYKSGTNPELDHAIRCKGKIDRLLQQGTDENFSLDETLRLMAEAVQ